MQAKVVAFGFSLFWMAHATQYERRKQGLTAIDEDCILGSDLFSDKLEILSASVGFDGVLGVSTREQDAQEQGIAWNFLLANLTQCPVSGDAPPARIQVSGFTSFQAQVLYHCDEPPDAYDGYPICFSWPVLPCSLQREHIQYTRSDGEVFSPLCLSAAPNNEFNERHCIVFFDDFINRKLPGEAGRLSMDRIDIVGDILFVGPGGQNVSGKGLSRVAPAEESPYVSGPVFVGSRLSPLDTVGEGVALDLERFLQDSLPNSGVDLYGEMENRYRLRLFYSGGMSIDGLLGLRPDKFSDYFILQFQGGSEVTQDHVPITVGNATTVTVLGLADLGQRQDNGYDLCHLDDYDNYIDIILDVDGDPTVLHGLRVLAFSTGLSLYNIIQVDRGRHPLPM